MMKSRIIIALLFTILLAVSGCGLTYNTDNPDVGLGTDSGTGEQGSVEQLTDLYDKKMKKFLWVT